MPANPPRPILPLIVLAQFCCTSIWFAPNAVAEKMLASYDIAGNTLQDITSAVQFGFIIGTLLFAILCLADRFSPSRLFFFSALAGAGLNAMLLWEGNTLSSLLILRFLTGITLAGVYPVGMKIAADYYERGLGRTLGYLVGALVLGTAFPHFLSAFGSSMTWQSVVYTTTFLSTLGGIGIVTLVPDGPYRRPAARVNLKAAFNAFKNSTFRKVAFGYFGHMWELYTFWAFVPWMILFYNSSQGAHINVPLWSFLIIGIGSVSCASAGLISLRVGTLRVAKLSLGISMLCCLASPAAFLLPSAPLFLLFMMVWGAVVVSDSPLFSTSLAKNSPPEIIGSALTVVNGLGYALTIISLQGSAWLMTIIPEQYALFGLGLGPLLGLWSLAKIGR
ncbi:MFS transporter [Echinicola pacifica]|nr:MFS transporter [Echinicola pacifica]